MDLHTLRQQLATFENRAAHSFTMSAGAIAWPAVQGLLNHALANQTLAVTAIAAFPPVDPVGSVDYQGQATLFPWTAGNGPQATLSVTCRFTVDGAGNPQLFILAAPGGAAPWHIADSLDGLDETILTQVSFVTARFLLTSTTTRESSYPGPLDPYVNFDGVIDLQGAFALTTLLLASASSRRVTGAIDLGQPQPVMTLAPLASQTVTFNGIQYLLGAELRCWYKTFAESTGSPPYPLDTALLCAALRLGENATPLRLTMPLLPNGSSLPLSLEYGSAAPLSGWGELDPLSGGLNLGALIPAQVPVANKLTLNGLTLFLDLNDGDTLPQPGAIAFDVALDTSEWLVLPNNMLGLTSLGAQMTVNFLGAGGPSASGSLYGTFVLLDEIFLKAAISIPELLITVSLDDGTTVSLAAVMAKFMQALTGRAYKPPIDMTVMRFELAASAKSRAFQLACAIVTDWNVSLGSANGGSLITLAFNGIDFELQYDGQNLAGGLTAYTSIDDTPFYLSAATEGGDQAGWVLSAGIQPGGQLSVSQLLAKFLYPNGQQPGGDYGIPSLAITRLALMVTTDPDNTPYLYTLGGSVELGWNFSLFGATTLRLAASLDLAGSKELDPDGKVPPSATWELSGVVSGQFTFYGLLIEAGYRFDPANTALTFAVWYGTRGLEASVTQKLNAQKKNETLLGVRLGDLSLGEVLEFLVGLALPGGSRRLSSPWDVLYQINFRNLSLVVNLTTNAVEIRYALDLNLGFAQLDAIGLTYRNVNGEGAVTLGLYGNFLGQPYGEDDNSEPLSWDLINEPAPAVPGKGNGQVDIRFVALGQHIALSTPVSQLDTIDKVITALEASMGEVHGQGNPLTDPAAATLRYDGNSKWMFGLDATLLETFTLAAVFFDPFLYGASIAVQGERGGSLNGLRFELLYRRITDSIGEFSVDLRIPDQFRNWEFGEVSVTLGIIHLDIYTNGNFKLDVGFPHNQNFSVSFAVQVFPFIGQGGFYFGLLTGATSQRVPAIINGTFDPVIELGLGLAVGLGKEFNKGPLKAGLSVEMVGIFEGVFAPFHPYDAALPKENYYWFQATVGITGKLYGAVDFVLIKASVSLVARALATVLFEAHRQTLVSLRVEVTASAKVKVLFITIHFSFSLTVETSFTIGSNSATPWIEGTPSHDQATTLLQARALGPRAPSALTWLRQQRPQRRPPSLSRISQARRMLPGLAATPAYRSLNVQANQAATPAPWAPLAVFGAGTPRTARVQFLPGFTLADPSTLYAHQPGAPGRMAATADANETQFVLMLTAENSVDPSASGAAQSARVTTDHLHHSDADGQPAFSLIVEALLRWAAAAGAGVSGTQSITLFQLEDLLEELADPAFRQATFDYTANLVPFLVASLHFEVAGYPDGTTPPSDTSASFVPIIPGLQALCTEQGQPAQTRGFWNYHPVGSAYAANLDAYFQQLNTNYLANVAADPFAPRAAPSRPAGLAAATGDDPSFATLIFQEYCALVTRAAVQAAIDLLTAYPYTYPAANGPSLHTLAGQFDTLTTSLTPAKGQSVGDLAHAAGLHPARLQAANSALPPGAPLTLGIEVTALSIAQDNQDKPLISTIQFNVNHLPYQVQAGQSLVALAAAAPHQAPAAALQPGIDPPPTASAVGTLNQAVVGLLRAGATLTIPSFTYTRLAGDSDAFLQAFFQVRNEESAVAHADWYAQAIATLNPAVTDWNPAVAGTLLNVPSAHLDSSTTHTYPVHAGDTLARIAATFALYQQQPDPQPQPPAPTYVVPTLQHPIGSLDTFASLVTDFPGLTLASLLETNQNADLLTPLAGVTLPSYGAQIGDDQTPAKLAAALDLALVDLVEPLADTPALFVGATPLTIRDVPARAVDLLVTDLLASPFINQVANQASRFMMQGVRVPSPEDADFTALTPQQVLAGAFTGPLYGLYDLTGQQFRWRNPATAPVTVALTNPQAGTWVTLVSTTTHDGTTAPSATLRALNPRLAAAPSLPAGRILATGGVTELDLTITRERFGPYLPSTTLTLHAQTPQAMVLYDGHPPHYTLQANIHWQAAARPALPNAAAVGTAGEPTLWLFSDNLAALARQSPWNGGDPFGLAAVSLDAPPDSEGNPLLSYAWATLLPFTVRRIPASPLGDDTNPEGRWLDQLYLVEGSDQAGEDLLYALWTYLQQNAAQEAGTTLHLLYAPNATEANPNGLASDACQPGQVTLLKTNLSTDTRDPSALLATRAAGEAEPLPPASAGLDLPTRFLTFLWEATVVTLGGFYLHYDLDGAGLPPAMFDEDGRGELSLLCLLGSQGQAATSGGPLRPVNNCAVVGDNVDAAAFQVYGRQTGGAIPQLRTATVPPGNVGFTLLRDSPEPTPDTAPSAEQLAGMLYNLVGYTLTAPAGSPFNASNEGVPVAPTPPADGATDQWFYHQVFNVARQATAAGRISQHCAALPSAADDPYAGLGPNAMATLSLVCHDAFGNQAIATDPLGGVSSRCRYIDRLIGLGEWPGATFHYLVQPPAAANGSPSVAVECQFQAANYLPAPGLGARLALQTANAHALRYRQIFYQLNRPGMSLTLDTSLVQPTTVLPPLSLARFAGFVAGAYTFVSQVAGLTALTHDAAPLETLPQVANAYSVTQADLLAANQEQLANRVLAGQVGLPLYDRFKHNETLNTFATRNLVQPLALLSQGHNDLAPVPAGLTVQVASRSWHGDGLSNLATLALNAACTVGELGSANADAPNLLCDNLTLTVREVSLVTQNDTFTSLVNTYAGRGITTSAAEIAVCNASVAGIFRAGSVYQTNTTVLAAPTTLQGLVGSGLFSSLQDLVTRNGDTPGLIVAATRLQTAVNSVTPPDGETLQRFIVQLHGLAWDDFVGANANLALAAPVELLLPALLDPSPLAATPYAIQGQQSLTDVATLFHVDAATLGASIQDLGGLFLPGLTVAVGSARAVTDGEESLAVLRSRFQPTIPTLEALIQAIAGRTDLLRPGALLVCPTPTTPADATTLQGLANRFGVDLTTFATANGALDGFLDATRSLTLQNVTLPVGPHATLVNLLSRFGAAGVVSTFADFVASLADQPLLAVGARFLLPPPAVRAEVALPVAPDLQCTLTQLTTQVTLTRPGDEIDPDFVDQPGVGSQSTPLAPLMTGTPATLDDFADGLEAAYPVRLANGQQALTATTRAQSLFMVRLEPPPGGSGAPPALRKVAIADAPACFALPPLSNELISRTVAVRLYHSGADDPLPLPAEDRTFQSIDVQGWAVQMLEAIDLLLSPAYAVGAYLISVGNSGQPFDTLVQAKRVLAGRIAGQLLPVLTPPATSVPEAARQALQQALLVSLGGGFSVSAVLQLPTQVDAGFSTAPTPPAACGDRGGHRLSGKSQARVCALDTASTLNGVASRYSVDPAALTELLGLTPNLLATGTQLTLAGKQWTIGATDTLTKGAEQLGINLEGFAAQFGSQHPLFRDGVTLTIDGFSTTVAAGDTLQGKADALDGSLRLLALANQATPQLLTGTLYINGSPYQVTPATSSLAGMAQSLGKTVGELALDIAEQAVLTAGQTLHLVQWVPEHSLSTGKIDLDQADGSLNLLLTIKERSQYRRLLLNLGFQLTGLEYHIEDAPLTDNYQSSDWLHFVHPLTDQTAPSGAWIQTTVGQLDIPLPLAAYPPTPRLVGQLAAATYSEAQVRQAPDLAEQLTKAKAWTYTALIEVAPAAQDLIYLDLGFNFVIKPTLRALDETIDPFAALAEFTVNAAALRHDLDYLLLPPAVLAADPTKGKAARSAVEAMSTIATNVAANWGPVDPGLGNTASPDPVRDIVPRLHFPFRVETRARSGNGGVQVMDSLLLVRQDDAIGWGPTGQPPVLGYLNDAGQLNPLQSPVVPPGPLPRELIYTFVQEVPAYVRRVYALWYPDLDVTLIQNARTTVWLTRNEVLVPGQETNPAFVYRTPSAHFNDVAAPALLWQHAFAIGQGTLGGIGTSLEHLFTLILGDPPTAAETQQHVTARYGYRLAAPASAGPQPPITDQDLVSLVPVFHRPPFAYQEGVSSEMQTAIQGWQAANPPAPNQTALYSLEMTIFSDLMPERRQPLAEFNRLDYTLS